MKIGIDLDNTIIDYGCVFQLGAAEMGFLVKKIFKKSVEVKDYRTQNGQRIGRSYREKYMENGFIMPNYSGFQRFLDRAQKRIQYQ